MAKSKSSDGYQRGVYGALRTLMHFIVAVQFSYGIYYDFTYVHFPPGMLRPGGEFGGKLKFLTVWDAVRAVGSLDPLMMPFLSYTCSVYPNFH